MDWIKGTIYTSGFAIEILSAVLLDLGISGIEIEDETDFKNFLEENKAQWDYVDDELLNEKKGETKINFYISNDASAFEFLGALKNTLSLLKKNDNENLLGRLEISTDELNEEDWANNWKKYFKPMNVGDNILICPQWEEVPENCDRVVFKVNPGMSFGTGSHETTKLCIEKIEKYLKKDMTVLDLGSGSGILSIISLLMGAKEATAVDIDPNAVEVAKQNAKENEVDLSKYNLIAGNVIEDKKLLSKLSEKQYDIILANIVADVIIALKPIVYNLMNKDTVLITSGIINSRLDEVKSQYECEEFEIIEIEEKGEWASILLKKR